MPNHRYYLCFIDRLEIFEGEDQSGIAISSDAICSTTFRSLECVAMKKSDSQVVAREKQKHGFIDHLL